MLRHHFHCNTHRRSCESAISTLVNNIEKAIYNGQKTLVVSLDCSGAFDRILFRSMVEAIGKANLPKCIINWYKLVPENRKVLAEVQGQKYVAYPTKGTPQPKNKIFVDFIQPKYDIF